jgi:hypothetical protein
LLLDLIARCFKCFGFRRELLSPIVHSLRLIERELGWPDWRFNTVDIPELFRRSALFVDKLLRGTKVDELPVELPTKFELVLNLKTARALALEVPPTLLARADEVIE